MKSMTFAVACCVTMLTSVSLAQEERTKVPVSITTPDKVESKIGTLEFKDGYPVGDTASKIRDELDYLHGVEAFMNSIQGVSMYAVYKSFQDAGIKNGDVLFYTRLMNSKSIFLTGNADTIYYLSFVDLSKGPIVFEAPPDALGIVDDMWFRWVTDFGIGGAERGKGGTYLLVGPDYKGPLPGDGYFVRKSRTSIVIVLGRSFLVNDDPAPTVAMIKEKLRLYPYTPGTAGTTIASVLSGESRNLAALKRRAAPPRFVEGTGLAFNTVPPNDFGHYEMLDALVQMESGDALDPETAGQFAAIGIVKGKDFAPDARMQKILEKSVVVGNAASRTLGMGAHPADDFRYYNKSSAWWVPLWEGGYQFLNPPPRITKEGAKQFPNGGARKLHSRSAFFYTATGITPLMCMRIPGVGSQYLIGNLDATGEPFDGSKTYKVILPKNIPAARFWSLTLYDNQTRSMLQTPQLYPRAGSQSFPSPAAVASDDGSTAVYFSPKQPQDVKRGNWIQTDPKKGWFIALRLYSPLQSFFDKSWRISEIELVR